MTVELPKLKPAEATASTANDLILYGICDIGSMTEVPRAYRDAGLEKLFKICRFALLNKNEQMQYLHEYMKKLTEQSVLYTARTKGLEEGLAEGRKKGLTGLFADVISKVTGLSEDAIKAL